MIIVADTSPLNYLIQIDCDTLLPDLYGRIFVPSAVMQEQLAQEHHADLLLIDERKGRIEARRRGLATTGTLGVLLAAGKRGLIDPKAAYHRLITQTRFRTTAQLQAKFLS